ncbi:hypothetical protein [Brachybacterium sp. UNK5269]|uniref:hypothetical protein n=1 Tax=Brachybacterium sp. UNK5269 TaxID=3408576 RepID=UPI003BB03A14
MGTQGTDDEQAQNGHDARGATNPTPEEPGSRPKQRARRNVLIGAGAVAGAGLIGWGLTRMDLGGEGTGPGTSETAEPTPAAPCIAERDFPEQFPIDLEEQAAIALEAKTLEAPFTQVSVQDVAVFMGTDERERLLITQHGATGQIQLIPMDGDSETVLHHVEVGVNPGVAVGSGVCWFVTREDGRVLSVGPDPDVLQDFGSVSPDATSLYSPVLGPGGIVFGGSYPIGAVWKIDPASGQITVGPQIGDNEYVRSLAVIEGRLFVGTGGNEPGLYEIDTESLDPIGTHAVPGIREGGSVSRLVSMPGGSLLVYRDEEDGGSDGVFFEPDSGAFGAELSPGASTRSLAIDPADSTMVYVAADRVQRLDPRTYSVSDAGLSTIANPTAVVVRTNGTIVGISPDPDGAAAVIMAPLTSAGDAQSIAIVPSAHDITAVIPMPQTEQIAIGGYQADGIVVVDTEGALVARTAEDSGVQQVEGGIESGEGTVLVGSYGEGRLHEAAVVEGEPLLEAQQIADLGEEFEQARPVSWGRLENGFTVGTVPEQGRVGGMIHTLERNGDSLSAGAVVEDPADGRSVVGITSLGGDELIVTTSVLGGYGSEATADSAEIMRLSLTSGDVVWTTPVDVLDVYTPHVQKDRVFCGTTDGLLVLDVESGELLAHTVIGEPADSAGYTSARIEPWQAEGRFIHVARGQLSVVDLVDGTVARGSDGVGSPLALMGEHVYAASGAKLVQFTLPKDPDLAACED